jgi:hypothetical protein
VIYEAALAKSGRPRQEIREMVRGFRDAFEDEEEPLTIPRASGIMNVEGDAWFFGDEHLRVLTGRLLGQFQHRVAQYNYINEREVLGAGLTATTRGCSSGGASTRPSRLSGW